VRVRIHRGAHEIGGSCVEVEADGKRLVLDVGRPLNAERGEIVPLPDVRGLITPDPSLLGVVITHAHQDHWGLANQITPGVPIYMGEATSRILVEAAFWTTGLKVEPAGFLRHRRPFELGPFRITPFLNDHSAFDAYSLLVEAEGRRLFYTGDIRGHGRKASLFEQLLKDPPNGVNALLMEGTNIRPGSDTNAGEREPQATETEIDVEMAMATTMMKTPGMVLVVSSAQNVDRLVTIYRAAKRSGRRLVVDLYIASIATATGNLNIPQPGPDWPLVHVYIPVWQRLKVKESEAFERTAEVRAARVYEEWLADHRHEVVTMFSMQSGPALVRAGCLEDATTIWSLWHGYLEEPPGMRLLQFLHVHGIPLTEFHTSGHASVDDLQRLAAALEPDRVVPIHSFGAARFPDLFDNVTPEEDGVWWVV
jgi:ribonuclease J